MQINSIDLIKLRNADSLQFYKDASSIISANDPVKLGVVEQYNNLLVVRKTLEELFMPQRSNPITEEIIALDLRRDNAITGIVGTAQSLTAHFNSDINIAARILTDYFGGYGAGIARETYTSETAIITNIVADVATKPTLAAAVATVQLNDWMAELDTANIAFNKKYIARTQELAAANADTMKAKRVEAVNIYYDLRNTINAYFVISKGAAPYLTAINQLNALIEQYNKLLTGRSTGDAPEPAVAN